MKIKEDPRHIAVSQTNFGKVIGVTSGRVNQLITAGVVIRDETDPRGGVLLVESLQNYDRMKYGARPSGSGDADGGDDVDINVERAKREAAERKIAELKLAKMESRVYDARTVELVQTEMLSNLRTQLLGLPSKLAPIIEGHDKAEIYDILTKEIEERLGELAEYTPAQYTEEEISDAETE